MDDQMQDSKPERYWAAKPVKDCVQELDSRVDKFYEWLRTSGQYALWNRMNRAYYSGAHTGGELGTEGDNDEYTTIHENHLHNLGENIVVMVTGTRPNFEPRAKNSDHESATQVILGGSLLEQAYKEKDLEGVGINAVRSCAMFGESFGFCGWDPNAGREVALDPETGRIERTGDLLYRSYMSVDVARDFTRRSPADHQWFVTRDGENRFDLMKRIPGLADRIEAAASSWEDARRRPRLLSPRDQLQHYETDEVTVWNFYHEPSDALPGGRYIQFIDPSTILFDGPLPYPWVPLIRLAPEDMAGTQRGYTSFFDLLPLQHVANSMASLILSHVNNYGTGVWWTKPGSNISVQDLKSGFTLLKSPEKPEAMEPPAIPEAVIATAERAVQTMEAISGVNSVRRGTVTDQRSIQPQAAALLDAKAIEFTQGLQRTYVRFLERMGTYTIQLYQKFLKAPQVAMLVGKANRSYMKEFTGESLADIDRVTVDIGNPLSRTTSGRISLATMLLGMPNSPIQTPEQLLEVLDTGRLEPAIEATRAELLRIRSENERLSDGVPVQAFAYDHHPLDVKEHMVVISSPEARENPAVLQAVTEHIQQHIDLWRTTDPAVLMSLGIPPPPPPPMMTPPPGAPVTNGTPPPHPGASTATHPPAPGEMAVTNAPGAGPQPAMPQIAQPPVNPLTGEQSHSPIPPV